MQTLAELLHELPREGRVVWIGVRPAPRAPMRIVDEVEAELARGLVGDRSSLRRDHRRQVSLIQAEHLPVIAALCGRAEVPAEFLRRNIVVAGINLLALKDKRFDIGAVRFEGSGPCHPCSRMEAVLGPGGFQAMRGHGGITARVLRGGVLRLGDRVRMAALSSAEEEDKP